MIEVKSENTIKDYIHAFTEYNDFMVFDKDQNIIKIGSVIGMNQDPFEHSMIIPEMTEQRGSVFAAFKELADNLVRCIKSKKLDTIGIPVLMLGKDLDPEETSLAKIRLVYVSTGDTMVSEFISKAIISDDYVGTTSYKYASNNFQSALYCKYILDWLCVMCCVANSMMSETPYPTKAKETLARDLCSATESFNLRTLEAIARTDRYVNSFLGSVPFQYNWYGSDTPDNIQQCPNQEFLRLQKFVNQGSSLYFFTSPIKEYERQLLGYVSVKSGIFESDTDCDFVPDPMMESIIGAYALTIIPASGHDVSICEQEVGSVDPYLATSATYAMLISEESRLDLLKRIHDIVIAAGNVPDLDANGHAFLKAIINDGKFLNRLPTPFYDVIKGMSDDNFISFNNIDTNIDHISSISRTSSYLLEEISNYNHGPISKSLFNKSVMYLEAIKRGGNVLKSFSESNGIGLDDKIYAFESIYGTIAYAKAPAVMTRGLKRHYFDIKKYYYPEMHALMASMAADANSSDIAIVNGGFIKVASCMIDCLKSDAWFSNNRLCATSSDSLLTAADHVLSETYGSDENYIRNIIAKACDRLPFIINIIQKDHLKERTIKCLSDFMFDYEVIKYQVAFCPVSLASKCTSLYEGAIKQKSVSSYSYDDSPIGAYRHILNSSSRDLVWNNTAKDICSAETWFMAFRYAMILDYGTDVVIDIAPTLMLQILRSKKPRHERFIIALNTMIHNDSPTSHSGEDVRSEYLCAVISCLNESLLAPAEIQDCITFSKNSETYYSEKYRRKYDAYNSNFIAYMFGLTMKEATDAISRSPLLIHRKAAIDVALMASSGI
jgi:hypothetical protein